MNTDSFALITGATSGIGKATAELLAAQKKNLILVARRGERLHDEHDELAKKYGIEVKTFTLDVRDIPSIEVMFQEIKKLSIDVVVNNAGLAREKKPLEEYAQEDIDEMLETNIRGFVTVARLSVPFLKKTKGHLINISSIAGWEPYAGSVVYCGTKAFVRSASESLRQELLESEVRVTDIAPGLVETEFSLVRFKGDKQKAGNVYKGAKPMSPQDIADCILFALTRPAHVNIDQMLVMATCQAGARNIKRTE